MSMGTWKIKVVKKANKGSRTTGKSKGIIATSLQRYMCRKNRSWKHPLYNIIMGTGEFTRRNCK